MKSTTTSDGFTVVELLVGMLASSILALSVGAVLTYGWQAWTKNRESIAMQRNAMIAIRTIEHRVRNSVQGNVQATTDGLTFTNGVENFLFSDINFGSDIILLSGECALSNGAASVSFTLQTGNGEHTAEYNTIIYPRNIDYATSIKKIK